MEENYARLVAVIREISDKWSMAMNPAPGPPAPESPQTVPKARSFQMEDAPEQSPSKMTPEQLRERQLAAAVEAGTAER